MTNTNAYDLHQLEEVKSETAIVTVNESESHRVDYGNVTVEEPKGQPNVSSSKAIIRDSVTYANIDE